MTVIHRLLPTYSTVSESDAERLTKAKPEQYVTEVLPPENEQLPATLNQFIRNILELQSGLLKLRNHSPIITFELRRPNPESLHLQFAAPTRRLERKIRSHLHNTIPGIGFQTGTDGIPVKSGESLGGGVLALGRSDYFPLRTDFDSPPSNSLVAALHQDAMRDTKLVVQILFQPIAGHRFRRWWWTKNAYKHIGFLERENERLWNNRSATRREKKQAQAIEQKASNSRFYVTIRFLVIGAADFTPNRVKELAGAFNGFESAKTGQYFDMYTIRSLFRSKITKFGDAVADRKFRGWSRTFRATTDELAALVTIPDRTQENLETARP